MAVLQNKFPGRISHRGDINRPSRSCDLTLLDAEDCVYADKSSTLEHFKTKIRQVMTEILPSICQKVVDPSFIIL